MSRFRFRLQPVLDVRTRLRDERQRELALAQRELCAAQSAHAALVDDRAARREELQRDHRSFSVDALRATYAHLAYLDRAVDERAARIAACSQDVARAQARLLAANADRKVLETLRNRRFEAFSADAALSEQREVDDQNARRFGRAQSERENDHE